MSDSTLFRGGTVVNALRTWRADVLVVGPRVVVHAVVQNQERPRVEFGLDAPILVLHDFLHDEFLPLDEIRQNHRIVFAMNKNRRNHLFEEAVRLFCSGNDRA